MKKRGDTARQMLMGKDSELQAMREKLNQAAAAVGSGATEADGAYGAPTSGLGARSGSGGELASVSLLDSENESPEAMEVTY